MPAHEIRALSPRRTVALPRLLHLEPVCVYVCMYVCICVRESVYVFVYVYMYMCVCVYIYIYIYADIQTFDMLKTCR